MTEAMPTGASAAAIQSHYDLSNAFYDLWLDRTRTYSCALWYGDETLEEAQINKFDWHLAQAGAAGAKRLLDVGCGWGSVLRRAIESHGVESAVGLTLSEAQRQAIAAAPIAGAEIRLESWADHEPAEPYDAIISIGAFEHFARLDQSQEEKLAGYRDFFAFCHRSLKPGGQLSLQTITYQNSDRSDFSNFFATEIFPESDLPHLEEIITAARGLFEVQVLRNDRSHYARTSRIWLSNLRANRAAAVELVGGAKVATYEKYLALLAVGFHQGSMNLARIGFGRTDTVSAFS